MQRDPTWKVTKTAKDFKDFWFYHCDHLGTPQEMTDHTGAVIWKAEYKVWGECKAEIANPISSKTVKLFQIISVFKDSILMKRQDYITIVIVIIPHM